MKTPENEAEVASHDLLAEFRQRVADHHPTKFKCELRGESGVVAIDRSSCDGGFGLFGSVGGMNFCDTHPGYLEELGITITDIIR